MRWVETLRGPPAVATQVSLEATLVRDLVADGVARGLKYTSYDLLGFREIIELCGDSINLLAGPDEMLLPFLLMGADGGIGTTYNLVPELLVDLYAAWKNGQVEKAQQIQFQIDHGQDVTSLWIMAGSPSPDPTMPRMTRCVDQLSR